MPLYIATVHGLRSCAQLTVQAADLRRAETRALHKAALYLDRDDPGPVTVPHLHQRTPTPTPCLPPTEP